MKSDYRALKMRMFLQIIATTVFTAMFGLLLLYLLVDGILEAPFADAFVGFCRNYLRMGDNEAIHFYGVLFRNNKTEIMAAGFVVLLIIILGVVMGRFSRYFDQISAGVDRLLDESEQPIILKPELKSLQTRLNTAKTILRERKIAALEAEQRKNDLVVYLAHDLKTPLTSVIGYLGLLMEAPDMPEEQKQKYTAIAYDKALRLEELTNEFFDITRFNLQNIMLSMSDINLTMMLEQMADEFYPVLAGKKMQALIQARPGIMISGDADKLARVFNNLMKNAVSYGLEGSQVEINVEEQPESVRIAFRNQGRMISEAQLEHIFEKFYRLDGARSSQSGGSGLGLAIARKIVELHEGSISARSTTQFTEFVVDLPTMP